MRTTTMSEQIHTFTKPVLDSRGESYRVHVRGEENDLGSWYGWLEFEPMAGGGQVLRTDRETTQPEREDLEYWASGLEPVYLEGALGRAVPA